MKRSIDKQLVEWKNQANLIPLLIRGIRQVGKSYVIENFGQENFENTVVINFEYQPQYKACFDTLNPQEIISTISLISGQSIISGKTLLFLDEIQECPNAMMALRYFKEKMSDLHVISAGSLLEFILNDDQFRMPVGRVQYLYLHPLSFKEFLEASGNTLLKQHIEQASFEDPIAEPVHQSLLKLTRQFMALGGMPAVLNKYFEAQNMFDAQNIQSLLINTYRNDFGKYGKRINRKNLQTLFEKAPGLIAQDFKYVNVDKELKSRDIKAALRLLEMAGIVFKSRSTKASGLPLNTLVNEKKFKLFFVDIGLANRASRLDLSLLLKEDLFLINRGAITEQLVAQEIKAYGSPYELTELFYWTREQKSSLAEVDFIVQVDDQIIPVEVKSGTTGRLKSLRLFMEEKKSKIGLRISSSPLSLENQILSIPFYMIGEIPRLVRVLT